MVSGSACHTKEMESCFDTFWHIKVLHKDYDEQHVDIRYGYLVMPMDTWRLQCLLIPKWNSGSFQEYKSDQNDFWMPDQMNRIPSMSINIQVPVIWTLDTSHPKMIEGGYKWWSPKAAANWHSIKFSYHSSCQQQIWILSHVNSQRLPSFPCHPAYYHASPIIAYSWRPMYNEIVTALQHDLDIVRWGSYIWCALITWCLDSEYHN